MLRQALAGFGGVKRRFTSTGSAGGITVIDDYGHHPVEIGAVLETARQAYDGPGDRGRPAAPLHAACSDLFEEFCTAFNDADCVLVAPVYAAGEAPIAGVDRDALVDGPAPPRPPRRAPARRPGRSWRRWCVEVAAAGDLVVCLGAGSITAWANALPGQLQRLLGEETAA